jgi:carbamoyltransferase
MVFTSRLILGVNTGHDSGVTVIQDNQVVFAENEERISRIKGFTGFPLQTLQEAQKQFDLSKVEVVAIEGKRILPIRSATEFIEGTDSAYIELLERLGLYRFMIGSRSGVKFSQDILRLLQIRKRSSLLHLFDSFGLKNARKEFFDHHMAHAASATLVTYSGDTAPGLSISFDASGEGFCSKICSFDGFSLTEHPEFSLPSFYSPANLYMQVTKLLGYTPMRHEGKITGLAAFGNPMETGNILENYFYFDKDNLKWVNKFGYRNQLSCRLTAVLKDFNPEDIAAGIQLQTERNVLNYIEHAVIPRFGNQHIYLSGGLFANVKLNQRIAESNWCDGLTVAPNMGDGGLSLGAAKLAQYPSQITKSNMYLGHEILESQFSTSKLPKTMQSRKLSDSAFEIAVALSKGLVVALSIGKMEFGPRALCHRSILYTAKDKEVNTWLNKKLKRTEFMPFAPVVQDVHAGRYFKLADGVDYSSMTVTCEVHSETIQRYPAIVHVDNTARPQIIDAKSELVYEVLDYYAELTGEHILVNTSYNMHEEPIVRTIEDSIRAFELSNLDKLFIPGYEISLK